MGMWWLRKSYLEGTHWRIRIPSNPHSPTSAQRALEIMLQIIKKRWYAPPPSFSREGYSSANKLKPKLAICITQALLGCKLLGLCQQPMAHHVESMGGMAAFHTKALPQDAAPLMSSGCPHSALCLHSLTVVMVHAEEAKGPIQIIRPLCIPRRQGSVGHYRVVLKLL